MVHAGIHGVLVCKWAVEQNEREAEELTKIKQLGALIQRIHHSETKDTNNGSVVGHGYMRSTYSYDVL